jgi:hypothetical protein
MSTNKHLVLLKLASRNLKRKQAEYWRNVAITEKCHILSVVYFIGSVYVTATSRAVTEQTKAGILCAVKCWMLTLKHNKHITAPYATPVLSGTTGCTSCVWENSRISADTSQQHVNLLQPLPLFTWRCAGTQTLTSRYTDGISNDTFDDLFIYKILNFTVPFNLWPLTLSVFEQHFKVQQMRFSIRRTCKLLGARLQNSEERPLAASYASVCLYAWNNSAHTGLIFIKFNTRVFF